MRLMANAASWVMLVCPPTALQERLIMEGVSGSRQFFDMNSRGGRKLFNAGSSSNILFALSATFPPLSSSIRWHCSFRVDLVYIIYRYFVVLLLGYSFWPIRLMCFWKVLYVLQEYMLYYCIYINTVWRVTMMPSETGKKGSPTLDTKEVLMMLVDRVSQLNHKLDSVVESSGKMLNAQEEFLERFSNKSFLEDFVQPAPDMMTLLSLPGALRKTMMACYKLREASAADLSRETERLRAVESACANQLVRMGFLSKRREGRKVHFYVE